jgi:hypothetical protein
MSIPETDHNSDEPSASSSFSSADYNDQLADKITTLAGQINAAEYRFLKLIAEFDLREAWAAGGIRSCAHWLNWKCGISMGTAREKVRVARALDGLPAINSDFEKGELSFSKVRAMTRVATEQNESQLLMIAQYGTAQHVEVLVRAFRTVTRSDELAKDDSGKSEGQCDKDRDQLQRDKRSVSCYQDDEGMWIIQAKLPAEEGGLLVKVLKELGDQFAESATQSEDEKSVPAGTETFQPNEDIAGNSVILDKLTFPQRRADALVALSEHYLASCTDSAVPSLTSLKAAERCQLVLHVRDDVSDSASNTNLDGRWLLPGAARRLACDASLLVVKEDSAGNVLNIGRKSRIIPPAMSRALGFRDGGCQFPGCCESRYVEGHHIKHWADGGDTKLDNLVTLCRYHHRELHRGAFFLSVKPSNMGKAVHFRERLCFSTVDRYFDSPFSRSKDFVIAANPAKFTCACCDFSEFEKRLADDVSETITAQTAVTKWTGERMDLSMAVDGLLWASGGR